MSITGKAKRRSIYQPDRDRKGFRHSDSLTFVQTHFWIGKYWQCKAFWRGLLTKVLTG